jgi:transcriptional regulator with XRE-family HTH domain
MANATERTVGPLISIGRQIRKERKHRKMTQKQLGSAVPMDHTDLSRVERGKDLKVSQLLRIAEVFGIPPSQLLED